MRGTGLWSVVMVGAVLCMAGQVTAGEVEARSNPVPNGAVITDGNFADWAGVVPFMADPVGDGGLGQDWRQLWVAHDDTYIYLRLERAPGSPPFGDGYRIALDTDQKASTGATSIDGVTLPIGAEYATNGSRAISRYMPSGCERPGFGPVSGWAGDARISFEFKVERTAFYNPVDFNFVCLARVPVDDYPDNYGVNYFNYTTGTVPNPLPAGMVASLSNQVPDGSIVIDGNTLDWAGVTPFPMDTPGDTGRSGTDWQQIWMAHDSTYFYFRLDRPYTSMTSFMGSDGESWFVAVDTDKNPSGIWPMGSVGAEFLILGGMVIYDLSTWANVPQLSDSWRYQGENVQGAGTVSFEGKIARATLGNPTEFNFACWGYRSGDWYPGTTNTNYFHYTTGAPLSAPLPDGMVLSLSNPITPGTITIDGSMSDWASITAFPADTPGDTTGANDWTQIWIAHDDTYFYFREQRTLNSTPFTGWDGYTWYLMLDTDRNPGTGLSQGIIGMEWLMPGMDEVYHMPDYTVAYWDEQSAESWDEGPLSVELKIRRDEISDPAAINLVMVGRNQPDLYPDGGSDWFKYTIHEPTPPVVDVASRSNPVAPGAIVIDGSFDDWAGVESYPVDPPENLQFQDFRSVSIAHDDTNVYVLLEVNALAMTGGFGSGYWTILDTDMNRETGYTGELQRPFSIGGDFAILGGGYTVTVYPWNTDGCTVGAALTTAQVKYSDGMKVEVSIPRADLGLTSPLSKFRILCAAWKSYDYLPEGGDTGNAYLYEFTRCIPPYADTDGDHDVDQEDFGVFQNCFTGALHDGGLALPCLCFDLQGGTPDGSIDLADYTAFLNCWSGPKVASPCQ